MKATEQYFPVVLVIMLYKVVLAFEPVHKILRRNHPNGAFYLSPGQLQIWKCELRGVACDFEAVRTIRREYFEPVGAFL